MIATEAATVARFPMRFLTVAVILRFLVLGLYAIFPAMDGVFDHGQDDPGPDHHCECGDRLSAVLVPERAESVDYRVPHGQPLTASARSWCSLNAATPNDTKDAIASATASRSDPIRLLKSVSSLCQ